jgi:6-pyruvoyltetrahydropterin/6-carboxytetrahydropterin synthase
MYFLKKVFKVPTGHRLSKHQGLCKNIHGHNLKIEVKVFSEELNDNGMVIDFKDLSNLMKEHLDKFDHAILLNAITEKELYKFVKENNYKHLTFSDEPTAENIAKRFYYDLEGKLHDLYPDVHLKSITVWENDDSAATFKEISN